MTEVLQVNLVPEALQEIQDQMESRVMRDFQDLKESRGLWVNLESRVKLDLLEKKVNRVNLASEVLQDHLGRMDIREKMGRRVIQVTVDVWEKVEKEARLATLDPQDLLEILVKKAFQDLKENRVYLATAAVQERRVRKARGVTWEKWAHPVRSDRRVNEVSKVLEEPEDLQVYLALWDLRENQAWTVTRVMLASQVLQAPRDQREKRVIQVKTVRSQDLLGP